MKRNLKLSVTVLFALLIATSAFPQGNPVGTISGTVTDASGGALPGATVEITNEEKGYHRTEVTQSDGSYRFPLVAVGRYQVMVSLSGFDTVTRPHNLVEAQKTTTVDVALRLGSVAAEITVTGEVPIVDKTSPASETRFRKEELEVLPVGRGYQAIFGNAPGVSSAPNAGNPTVHGALTSSNQYQFDGMDLTDPTTGTFAANLNYEAVQEVMVYTSGISAEYGRATGAVVNVITKSGSNTPEGSAKYIVTNDEWNEDNKTFNQVNGASLARTKFDKINPRHSYTLGGPLWRDRAWFFGAFEDSENESPNQSTPVTGEEYRQTRVAEFGNYRLTVQANPRHSFWGKWANDPDTGIVVDYWAGTSPGAVLAGEREALTLQGQGGENWGVNWNGIFGSNFAMEALYSQFTSVLTVGFVNQDDAIDNGSVHYDLSSGFFFNGPTFVGGTDRPRKSLVVAGSYFTQLGDNNHDMKIGVDWQDLQSQAQFGYPNNRVYYDDEFDPVTRAFIPNTLEIYDDPQSSTSEGTILGLFARDKFEIGDRFFVEAGLRFDQQEGTSDIGVRTFDSQTISPRLAASFDLVGNGKTLVVGTLGRFYQFLIQSYADTFAAVPQQEAYTVFEWNGSEFIEVERFDPSVSNLRPNEDLDPTYMDELTLGFEQQIGNTIGVGIRGVFREWNDIIDDIRFFDASGDPQREFVNYDEAERDYLGVEFVLDKRFSNNWSGNVNYTWSEAKGNHFASFQSGETGANFGLGDFLDATCVTAADPSIGNNGSIPCAEVANGANKSGLSPNNRPHYVKGSTAYSLPLGPVNLTLGVTGNWRSGVNFQQQRTISVIKPVSGSSVGTLMYFYEDRGARRLPDVWELDTALEATWRIWRSLEFGFKAEAFNVTDNQEQITVNQTTYCAADAPASCVTARNNFGKATARSAFQAPRGFRLTGLIRF